LKACKNNGQKAHCVQIFKGRISRSLYSSAQMKQTGKLKGEKFIFATRP
tara:strand:- start:720 stop:866 length:147 start_codon:yes stop_codon:yes gene_type:complete